MKPGARRGIADAGQSIVVVSLLTASAPPAPKEQACDGRRDGGQDGPVARNGCLRQDRHRVRLMPAARGRCAHADTVSQ